MPRKNGSANVERHLPRGRPRSRERTDLTSLRRVPNIGVPKRLCIGKCRMLHPGRRAPHSARTGTDDPLPIGSGHAAAPPTMVPEHLQLAKSGASAALLALLVTAMERVPYFFSEGAVEGLVRPVIRVGGCGGSQDASCCQRPLRGGTPRRETSHPDPSPDEEWMEPGLNGIAGTGILAKDSNAVVVRRLASCTNISE